MPRFLQTVIIIQRGKWLSLFNRPCPGPAFSGTRSKRYAWQVLLLNVFLSSPRRTRIAFSERIILQAAITRCGSIELHTRALRVQSCRDAMRRDATLNCFECNAATSASNAPAFINVEMFVSILIGYCSLNQQSQSH